MELSKLAIIGLVTLGVGAIVLAGYVVYQLGRNRVLTPPPQADVRPVPETTERAGEAGNIVGFRQEWRQTG